MLQALSYSCIDVVCLHHPGHTDVLFRVITFKAFKRCVLLAQEKHIVISSSHEFKSSVNGQEIGLLAEELT